MVVQEFLTVVTVDSPRLHGPLAQDVLQFAKDNQLGFAEECPSTGIAGDHIGYGQRIGELTERRSAIVFDQIDFQCTRTCFIPIVGDHGHLGPKLG